MILFLFFGGRLNNLKGRSSKLRLGFSRQRSREASSTCSSRKFLATPLLYAWAVGESFWLVTFLQFLEIYFEVTAIKNLQVRFSSSSLGEGRQRSWRRREDKWNDSERSKYPEDAQRFLADAQERAGTRATRKATRSLTSGTYRLWLWPTLSLLTPQHWCTCKGKKNWHYVTCLSFLCQKPARYCVTRADQRFVLLNTIRKRPAVTYLPRLPSFFWCYNLCWISLFLVSPGIKSWTWIPLTQQHTPVISSW